MKISFTLNEMEIMTDVELHETLLQLLRRRGMISVRYGSGSGETGASAVLIDGRLTSTDCMLAIQIDGHDVKTVEWFNKAELHPIQAAFVATGAMQSGYSTPAMILGTWELLNQNPNPTEHEVRDMLSGILDRDNVQI